ncbi:phosphonate metabolism protein/1,5-bisphosphokinase (PRPP-forming) PhnN [Labrenzia sp. 011]|uniref:phosphonate metabolism protein/1,5-bisphosphokinase (PRPP-forming) PhnN n=1 Tax=Labrenzia sp. 011 TaxID=2171494 RepID=UPI000D508CF4|nr:phosphonate metabolism protein/1,5-bisphosphokinase (PRPP-forming) PhnN [Labrenzia sp. 011]PVB60979.1 phosphonate metabolism protein/1,5-bisphosphokinase (PRPP-forming) PhnN [Labrenzia sp. 011]
MTLSGTLFLVVGPSGVGKDTLLDGAKEALRDSWFFRFCQRYITRDPDKGGEDYLAVGAETFQKLVEEKSFFHHWDAHGLRYGIPADIRSDLEAGRHVVVNVSRLELPSLARLWSKCVILSIEASPEVIAERLLDRGRETRAEIESRIARSAAIPDGETPVIRIRNDHSQADGIAALTQAIIGAAGQHFLGKVGSLDVDRRSLCTISAKHPAVDNLRAVGSRVEIINSAGETAVAQLAYETGDAVQGDTCLLDIRLAERLGVENGATLELRPAPSPDSREMLRKKIRGLELEASEMEAIVDDMVHGRYSDAELAGFLVCAATSLSTSEVVALTKSRGKRTENVKWSDPIVVDKHSMGGIPGNRITPIVIPIVTAAGLKMPKTSSRAITSAAGTADAMEVVARVDLSADELRRVVHETGGCIAWNGRLTHSPVDDVMNAINRPLGLKSDRLDVSSILSKKLAAGSTHVLIDMPVGPEAKTKTLEEAAELETLFVTVAEQLAIQAKVMKSDGTRPIGRGIGPVLEMRDVMAVLEGQESAPLDLREKALLYAATILEWVGAARKGGGWKIAEDLLRSGAAHAQFGKIARAQGLVSSGLPAPAQLTGEILAAEAGRIIRFGVASVSSIARTAGAPQMATAGVELLVEPNDLVEVGQPVMRIYSASGHALKNAEMHALKHLEDGTLIMTGPVENT